MKPTEFFIGVIDLFAILLPGAIATWIAAHFSQVHGIPLLTSLGVSELSGTSAWLSFFVGSYILGHIAHTVSAYLDHMPWIKQRCSRIVTRIDPNAAKTADAVKMALTFLIVVKPESLTEVRRLDADSKFFRSLVVVLTLIFLRLVFGLNTLVHAVAALASAVLIGLSFVCYIERREKAIALAIRLHLLLQERELRADNPAPLGKGPIPDSLPSARP